MTTTTRPSGLPRFTPCADTECITMRIGSGFVKSLNLCCFFSSYKHSEEAKPFLKTFQVFSCTSFRVTEDEVRFSSLLVSGNSEDRRSSYLLSSSVDNELEATPQDALTSLHRQWDRDIFMECKKSLFSEILIIIERNWVIWFSYFIMMKGIFL